jgi:hypothetical protein
MDVIVDIDGTVADCTHRRHYIEHKPKNWKAFFAGIPLDPPIIPVIQVVQALHNDRHRIIMVSARNEDSRKATEDWLEEHLFGPSSYERLYMRKANDYREDSIVKKEILDQIIKDGYNPILAIDDRKRVVDMWRANGILALHCAEGDF